MKTLFRLSFLIVLSLHLIGCSGSSQSATPLPITETFTQTSTAVVTETATPLPTITRRPTATLTITPALVQIPRSIFDAGRAITQTPFPAVQCPPNKSNIAVPDLDTLNKNHGFFEKTMIDILSTGGIQSVISTLSKSNLFTITRADLTHDSVSELIVENRYNIPGILSVFGCDRGQYKKLLTVNAVYDYTPGVMKIIDMNLNGMPDLALIETTCHYCLGIRIFEWDGKEFKSLMRDWFFDPSRVEDGFDIGGLDGFADANVIDVDGNGTYEVVVKGGGLSAPGDAYLYGPHRSTTKTYMWDGRYYSIFSEQYSPPEYRFQAIQDGDDATLLDHYEEALTFYQDAIFNDQLKSWSREEKEHLIAEGDAWGAGNSTPTPLPPHNEDYSQLAAYARYRIMLLHLMNGFQKDAKVVYDTLQEKFPESNEGYPYAEMAKLVWDNFSITNDMGLACQQAVNYAVAHPGMLKPLSGPEFGFWSKSYQPEDVCPY